MVIVYYDPEGGERSDFDRAALIDSIRAADPERWRGPAGQAALARYGDGDDRWLFLTLAEPGTYFVYAQLSGGRKVYAAASPADADRPTSVSIGGNEIGFPALYLAPADLAARIADHFIDCGTLLPEVQWHLEGEPFLET